jgi:uncharacterized protein (DUF58 family)
MFWISKMKNRALILLVFIIMVLLTSQIWGLDAKAPEIFFEEKTYSAGDVIEGAILEHTYTVYNRGNSVLKIRNVRPG